MPTCFIIATPRSVRRILQSGTIWPACSKTNTTKRGINKCQQFYANQSSLNKSHIKLRIKNEKRNCANWLSRSRKNSRAGHADCLASSPRPIRSEAQHEECLRKVHQAWWPMLASLLFQSDWSFHPTKHAVVFFSSFYQTRVKMWLSRRVLSCAVFMLLQAGIASANALSVMASNWIKCVHSTNIQFFSGLSISCSKKWSNSYQLPHQLLAGSFQKLRALPPIWFLPLGQERRASCLVFRSQWSQRDFKCVEDWDLPGTWTWQEWLSSSQLLPAASSCIFHYERKVWW